MSKDLPDPYGDNYNSDKYTIPASDDQYELYANKENSFEDPFGPLQKGDLGGGPETLVESDDNYYKEVYSLYSNVLDANGMNLLDPYMGYMTHFNKMQRLNIDPPYGGKTYIFITRPDLNFWRNPTGVHNVETVDLFSYFSRMNIGISTMPWLMFPHDMELEFVKGGEKERTIRNRIGPIQLFEFKNGIESDNSFKNNAFTPFIPILSNTCTSSSGGQDLSLETEETEGDLHGNKLQYAKGAESSFAPGEITLEFNDVWGSPVMHLMNLWVHYIHYLTKGHVITWEKYIQYRILDYTCSIYIFETDRDNSTILRWAKYTGCFPKSVPLGNIQHNMETDVEHLRKLSIPFAYNRYEPMKPAALMDFNFLMNKFIFDSKESNRKRVLDLGAAPSKLILPHDGYDISNVLNLDPNVSKPYHYAYASNQDKRTDDKIFLPNDTNYYDNKFWGSIPYILNHKLVWIDPKVMYENYNAMKKRSDYIDSKVESEFRNIPT